MVAHRGTPGRRLEHTAEAYCLAVDAGADALEPDLVVSADGALVVRHDAELSATTDVARHRRFAGRRRTLSVDGTDLTGWFVHDFTLDELRELRCTERWPDRRPDNVALDGRSPLLTFDDVLAVAADGAAQLGRAMLVYPELKYPSHFAALGLDPVSLLVDALRRHGLDSRDAPVLVQCFEPSTLRRLADTVPVPLAQLVEAEGRPFDHVLAGDDRTYRDLVTDAGLAEVASYADVLAAAKDMIIPRGPDGRLTGPTSMVRRAHEAGLDVCAWTFRDENAFLPTELRVGDDPAGTGRAEAEYAAFLDAGVDAVFSDDAATAVAARRAWTARP